MTSRIALIAGTISLLAAAPAGAKELGTVSLCGADGCTDVTKRATQAVVQGGPVVDPPRRGERFFVMRIGIAEEKGGKIVHRFSTRWLPKSALLRGADGVWMTAPKATQAELLKLSAGLRPLPRSAARRLDAGERKRATRPKAPAPGPVAAPEPVAPRAPTAEEDGGGGPGTALAIGAPALVALGIGGLLARRRRPRRG